METGHLDISDELELPNLNTIQTLTIVMQAYDQIKSN